MNNQLCEKAESESAEDLLFCVVHHANRKVGHSRARLNGHRQRRPGETDVLTLGSATPSC